MSFQRFFRFYKNISGMSGTLQNIESELWQIYKLPTLKIPKRIPNSYEILPEKIYATKKEKWEAVVKEIEKIHKLKRPILVGTRTITDSENLSLELDKLNIKHTLLNALHHESEAEIISQAGESSKVTIATNMAGRGTDIVLTLASIKLGGLHVVATERHESKRVDMQLFGRSARQGQPGSVQAILSLEDDIMIQKCPIWLRKKLINNINSSIWKKISLLTYMTIQQLTDKKASKIRRKMLENDFSMSKMLSFSDK